MLQTADMRRRVVVDGAEYFVALQRSQSRHYQRFSARCYALVELPNRWQATVPIPDCVRSVEQLWYRELIELVDNARTLVGQRSDAA